MPETLDELKKEREAEIEVKGGSLEVFIAGYPAHVMNEDKELEPSKYFAYKLKGPVLD